MLAETTDNDASLMDETTQILVDLEIFNVPTDRPLTPETAAKLSSLWDRMYAERETEREGRASLPSAEELQIPPRELLERCTENGQGDSDALEIIRDLLVSLEYVRVAMNPRVQVFNGQQAEIRSTQHVPDPTAGSGASEMVECSTALKVTPHAESAGRITLDVAAEITDLIPSDSSGEKPHISRYSLNTKAVLDKDKTLVLRLEPTTKEETQDNGVLYLLVRPRLVAVEPVPGTVTATFQGEDLRQALMVIGERGRVNIIYDANISGEVWAELREVPLDTALETLLAGTPYAVQMGTNAYLITEPRAQTTDHDMATARVYRPITGTFQGTDLRQALKEVAAMAGANLMYDADLSGSVWATLQDVSLETALQILLAGSPYVARKTPDGYAITTGEQPPAPPSGEKMNALEVESRFLLVDNACMEALRGGLPIAGVTSPEDVNALHEIGAGLLEGKTSLLEQGQADLLLKAIRQYPDSKMLAAPRVTVLDAESATMSLSEQLNYVGGYREPNEASPEPIPQYESKTVGVTFDVTPHLVENRNDIRLQLQTEISSLLEMQKAVYEGKYEYDVPSFETITVHTEIVMLDGQTALIYGGQVRSLGGTPPGKNRPARPLLIFIKPKKTIAPPLDPMHPMMGGQGAGPGGMGALRPAESPGGPAKRAGN